MCNCVSEINKELEAYNTVIDTAWYPFLTGDNVRFSLSTCIKEKKRGAKAVGLKAIYCPICGTKYESTSVETTTVEAKV